MKYISKIVAAAALGVMTASVPAAAQTVTVGYQGVNNPYKVAIKDGTFERVTGAKIRWRKFDSGGKVITAMASGQVDIAMAGSSPIAAGVSRGLPIELFWIVEDIAAAEALVARDGTGINSPLDLRGKRIGVPFVSTTHFHTLFALEMFGMNENDVTLLNMQPNNIAAAWERGDIDATFIWDPALARVKETGKVLLTSGLLSSWGKATFDGMVVRKNFSRENPKFMCQFVKTMAQADDAYRFAPRKFGKHTPNAHKIALLSGANPDDVGATLALYKFPTLTEQASPVWLGGGSDGGAATALRLTSEFILANGGIDQTLSNYGRAVNSSFAKAARDKQC